MNLQVLSIQQLKSHGQIVLNDSMLDFLQNDLIITNNIGYGELFKHPCRLDAITMIICFKGELKSTVNMKQYTLSRNKVFLGLPTDIVSIDSMTDFEMYTLILSDSFLREMNIDIQKLMQLYLSIRHNSTAPITDTEIKLLKHYYALTQEAIRSKDENVRDIIKGLLTALIYKIISYVKKHIYITDDATNKQLHRSEYTYDKFMTLLSEFYLKERYVKFYADKLCLTPKYLSAIIKKVSGKSIAEWIDEYVLLEAMSRLKCSNMSIQEIAYYLNFATQSSFGKYFKQQTGYSPKQFMNQSNHL